MRKAPVGGGLYDHIYGGPAVDRWATRAEVIHYIKEDPMAFGWEPNCKLVDLIWENGELIVSSTDDPDRYRVTHIMR